MIHRKLSVTVINYPSIYLTSIKILKWSHTVQSFPVVWPTIAFWHKFLYLVKVSVTFVEVLLSVVQLSIELAFVSAFCHF